MNVILVVYFIIGIIAGGLTLGIGEKILDSHEHDYLDIEALYALALAIGVFWPFVITIGIPIVCAMFAAHGVAYFVKKGLDKIWDTKDKTPLAVNLQLQGRPEMVSSVINIAHDFSRYPGGRFRADGDFSGEAFRDDLLVRKLREARASHKTVTVDMDGVAGYPASFLEEAFGGLVRKGYFSKDELASLLRIRSNPLFMTYRRLAERYIREAKPEN